MRSTSSPSSPSDAGPLTKLRQNWQLLQSYRRGDQKAGDLDAVFADIDEYAELARRFGGRTLDDSRVLEIGFGTRPLRLLALQRRGVDAHGVDMEVPLLRGDRREYAEMLRRNGIERTLKAWTRRTFFDRAEREEFASRLAERGWTAPVRPERFVVADAADLDTPAGSVDLVISEDVFEHVARDTLPRLVERLRSWLAPGGIALIRPNVFTGITGGHLIEWDPWSFVRPPEHRPSEPWEHLRRRRFAPNSYLNELRLDDYRASFARHFEIVEERLKFPDLGREFLSSDVRAELVGYSEEELMSNQRLFVLIPR